jgi:hypothetical protein
MPAVTSWATLGLLDIRLGYGFALQALIIETGQMNTNADPDFRLIAPQRNESAH